MRPNSFGGPYCLFTMPLKGFLITGGPDISAYYPDWEQAKAAMLETIVLPHPNKFVAETTARELATQTFVKDYGFKEWYEKSKKQAVEFMKSKNPKFTVIRVVNAFFCHDPNGFFVVEDVESVGLLLDEWIKPVPPEKQESFLIEASAAEGNSGRFTRQEVDDLLAKLDSELAAAPTSQGSLPLEPSQDS